MLTRIRRLRPAAFIAGFLAAIVLTGGGAAAYAANGGSLLIGRSNSATATTTLTNSAGIPMKLVAKPGYPPLTVNSTTTVPYLSADRLDGLSSGSFALAGGRTGSVDSVDTGDSDWLDIDDDGVGDPESNLIISWATCPTGSKLTGGGYDNYASGYTVSEFPDVDTWVVVTEANGTEVPIDVPADDLISYAMCYNPRGAVPGASAAAAKSSTELSRAAQAKIAKVAAKRSR
jgi:hypothetical protein